MRKLWWRLCRANVRVLWLEGTATHEIQFNNPLLALKWWILSRMGRPFVWGE